MTSERTTVDFGADRVQIGFGLPRLTAGVGAAALVWPMTVKADWLDPEDFGADWLVPLHLAGTLWATNRGMRRVADLSPAFVALRGFAVDEDLSFPLMDDQVAALDVERSRDALRLTLKLTATLQPRGKRPHGHRTNDVTLNVEADHWLRMLDAAGEGLSLAVRVPSPLLDAGASPPPGAAIDVPPAASRAQAVARLREARNEVRDGRYEAAVRLCRLALESLEILDPTVAARNHPKEARARDRDQAHRWAVIVSAVKELANGAHHDDGTTADFLWSRGDADAVLAATAGLLARTPVARPAGPTVAEATGADPVSA